MDLSHQLLDKPSDGKKKTLVHVVYYVYICDIPLARTMPEKALEWLSIGNTLGRLK